jgi:hypothetical protein
MGLSSASEAKETALVEPWLDVGEKLTEFFVTDEIEACARRTGLVRRTSTITGKVFLALGTLGAWAPPKTSVAQRTVKGARLPTPGAVWPEALPQRLTRRAVAFLRALLQRAVVKLQMGGTVGDAELWEPVTAVHHVESTGVEGPPSLQAFFPGSSGEASTAGAKILLVWEYRSPSFAPLALVAGTTPGQPLYRHRGQVRATWGVVALCSGLLEGASPGSDGTGRRLFADPPQSSNGAR